MQTTSSGWNHNIAKSHRRIGYGFLASWLRTTATGVRYFTINSSRIGGPDMIKGGGSFVTFFDKYQYGNYTEDVTSFSVSRKLGQFPYGTIMAEADVELDNTSRRYLPNYDQTIGSGILPNRPIKLSVGIEDEYVKCFVGFSSMPEHTLGDRITRMHAFDAFNFINGYKSTFSGAMVNAPFHNIVASGLNEMGFSSTQYAIDKSLQSNIGYLAPNGQKWGDIFAKGTEAEQALMFVDENGIIRFWNRQHFTTTSGTFAFALSYSSLSDLQWQNTPVINDVIVRAKPRSVQARQKIWELDSPLELLPGKDTELFANFSDDFGEIPTTSVEIPQYVTSATTSFYTTNNDREGAGETLEDYVDLITAYSFGTAYKMVFRNTYTSSIFITSLGIYATPAKVTTVIEQRYEDSDSIDTFGRNPANNGEPIEIENDLIQDKDQAYSLAYTLVKEFKDPRKKYIAPVAVGSNPALQIGDFGSLNIQDTGETKNVWITGITQQFDRDGNYQQVLELEERNIKKYFQINVSRIGGSDGHVIAP